MQLVVMAVGKLRDAAIGKLCDEYVKRSRSFVPIERTHVSDHASLWSKLERTSSKVVLLDERGPQIDSPTLAKWIDKWRDAAERRVTFVIGDADGFTDADRERADALLGLSRLTLPHRLAHLVLCEQLYRAGTILAGHPYHHA
jgi:23S rRNA (pseudouridine1915-N3)-methyltransferase